MADGSHVPIDRVQPGDLVLAADPLSGQWTPRAVLAQWSFLDQGAMATATLSDGSQITATDHHRFWVASDQRWVELDEVRSGDVFSTPTGPVSVADVTVTEPRSTLVWELSVAVDHSFAVSTGTVDVLVHNHNHCGPDVPGSAAHRDAQFERANADNPGLTRAEFDARYDALREAIGDLPDNIEIVGVDPVTGLPTVARSAPTPDNPRGDYIDLRTPELLQERAAEIFGSNDGDIVLGRQTDTARAAAADDKFALDVDDWSPELNDAIIQELIDNPRPIELVTDPFDDSVAGSIFERELQQLAEAGWEITPDGAYPPGIDPPLPTDRGPQLALPAGSPGQVVANALEPHELVQAQSVVDLRGGTFVGNDARGAPGIDGTLDGTPVSLKTYSGSSPAGVLSHASRAEESARKEGFVDVEVFIDASNVPLETIIDFGTNGPLAEIPSQGTVSSIYVQTADGWVVFSG